MAPPVTATRPDWPAEAIGGEFAFSLRSLVSPVDRAEFLDRYWDNAPCPVTRARPDYFASLLDLDDFDRILATADLREGDLRAARTAEVIEASQYTRANGTIDVAAVYALYAEGATVILQHLHRSEPSLARLCRQMSREFGMPFQTNVYLTPPDQQGFKPHYDSHDVFLLQLAGSKHWEIGAEAVRLPLKGQTFDSQVHDFGESALSLTLSAGDLLYLPRGVMHQGRTGDALSMHVTLGVQAPTWTDLMLEAVSRVCLDDPAFRRALPVGFGLGDFDAEAAAGIFSSLVDRLAGAADFAGAADTLAREFLARQQPDLAGQLRQINLSAELDSRTLVRPRHQVLARLAEDGDRAVLLGNGRELEFPSALAATIRFALRGPPFRADDLPGPDDGRARLGIVRDLLRQGFLVRHDPG